MMKRTQSALAARDGVFSAQLAACGTTAPRAAFEGSCGFYAMYENGEPAIVTHELGRRYEVLQMTYKKFPSCGCNHAAIEATTELMRHNRVTAEQIGGVDVRISPYMARLVGAKYDPGQNPLVAAQFSVQYSVASAILRGRLGLAELTTAAARDAAAVRLAHTINVIVDEARHDTSLEGEVTLRTAGGPLTKTIRDLPGSPQNPMSDADFAAKAIECFSSGVAPLTASQAKALISEIDTFDHSTMSRRSFRDFAARPRSSAVPPDTRTLGRWTTASPAELRGSPAPAARSARPSRRRSPRRAA